MNRSIPNAIQSPLKCGDNLVIHAPYPSEAFFHDLARFTIGRSFFPRSSLVADLNGKGKLGGEEDFLQENVRTLAQVKGEEYYCKAKNDVKASTD